MRQFMNIVETSDEITAFFLSVHSDTPLRRPLRESRRPTVLMEGPLAKKVKATIARVTSKYGEMQYDMLAKITMKALDVFQGDAKVSGTLQRILKVGRVAAQNRMLLAALAGIAGTLIGLSSNPAAAQTAAGQFDTALNGDLDRIIHQLELSGIHVAQTDLPQGVSAVVQKAAAALKAIQNFEFSHGMPTQAVREFTQSVTIDANITHEASRMIEEITVRTPDGQTIIAHIRTVVENGRVVADEANGVKFDLINAIGNLDPQQQASVDAYLSGQVPMPNGEGVERLIHDKAPEIAMLVAGIAAQNNASHVRLSAQGTQVREGVERSGEDGLTTKERKEFHRLQNRIRMGGAEREDYQRLLRLKQKRAK